MPRTSDFSVRFWGVRGSIACPGIDYARYGGNTSCVEVRCGDHLLIFDGGTGLRPLGLQLKDREPLNADLFFTHSHFDHIAGIPFFASLFSASNRFRMWAGHLRPQRTLRQVLCSMMIEPLFPVPIDIFAAQTTYHDFVAGETLRPHPDVSLRTAPLNHPNGATGYRIEHGGKAVCYVTDTEHVVGQPDQNILGLIAGADIVIYDGTYTDEEFPRFASWGHSTWQEGVRLADAAGAGRLVIFHHDPSHDDAFMDRVAAEAERARPGTIVAREGLTLTP
ncbi:MBL fold metallo-hydrolase [Virgifigura deserti]|uniref:MBL fold metallo-hydrolase n=1 Tax=Virgifigura deserti TaxID=2268457 RepID=UPI003CCBF4D8